MSWRVVLGDVTLDGSCEDTDAAGTLSFPPDGLGLPEIRTNDVTFAQRDGVRHYSDWYEPRIITLTDVTVCPTDCDDCASARARVRDILSAWGRRCDDTELVIWPDCEAPPSRTNLAPTPRPDPDWPSVGPNPTDTIRYFPADGATITYVASSLPWAPTATRFTTSTTAGSRANVRFAPAWSLSLWVRSSGVATVQLINSNTPWLVSQEWPEWTRLEVTGRLEMTSQQMTWLAIDPPVNGWVEFTGVLAEDTTVVGDYFDGDTGASGDLITSWSGIPFASTSTQGPDQTLYGPFGVIGRPRQAAVVWERGTSGCATLQLRFDCVDHRMYILDPDGTPGSGTRCYTLTPAIQESCRTYPRCYTPAWCYTNDSSIPGSGPVEVDVRSTVCVRPTITLYGTLTEPVIENTTTGAVLNYDGTIDADDPPVIINTEDGTATQGGASRTHLLRGDPTLELVEGVNVLRLTSFASTDTGHAEICFRDVVVTA